MKAPAIAGFVLLFAACSATPVLANWFSNPYLGINRNIGSAPNPTPEQIRQERLGEHQLFTYGGSVLNSNSAPSASSQTRPSDQAQEQGRTDVTLQTDAQAGKPAAEGQ